MVGPSADAPWTMTVTNTSTYAIARVGAQTSGTSVTCRVTVDGRVKDETSTRKYAVVDCTGSPRTQRSRPGFRGGPRPPTSGPAVRWLLPSICEPNSVDYPQ
ncbi:MmpS family transport accessory protein [Nocardia sp. NBC_00881]|uniref:MmpS family transport accessory protein n=1 Tax=Nocardia sp. NBC_00881 TaxID=2975995 RepID=UPI0038654CE3